MPCIPESAQYEKCYGHYNIDGKMAQHTIINLRPLLLYYHNRFLLPLHYRFGMPLLCRLQDSPFGLSLFHRLCLLQYYSFKLPLLHHLCRLQDCPFVLLCLPSHHCFRRPLLHLFCFPWYTGLHLPLFHMAHLLTDIGTGMSVTGHQ